MTSSRGAEPAPLVIQLGFGGIGGIAAVARVISESLTQLGYECAVVRHGPIADLRASSGSWDGLNVVADLPLRGRVNLRTQRDCVRIIMKMRPSAVIAHEHSLIPAVVIGFLLSGRLPKVVMVEHQANHLRSVGQNARSLVGLVFASALVVLTAHYAHTYPFRTLPLPSVRRMTVIPNGVDSGFFSPGGPRPGRGDRTIGTACRFNGLKDLRTLIDSVAILTSDRPGQRFRLMLAGDGPDLEMLIEHVASSGLSDEVEFVGRLDEVGLRDLYHRLDVYVQATRGETLSTAVLQALSCGLPVVASDVDGMNNLLTDGLNGLLVPVGDARALAEAVAAVCDGDDVRAELSRNGRQLVLDRYTPTVVGARYADLFGQIGVAAP